MAPSCLPREIPQRQLGFFPSSLIMLVVKMKISLGHDPSCIRQNDHLAFISKSLPLQYINYCSLKSTPCGKESSSLSLSCTKISMGILTRLTSSACLNQVSENIYATFFPSFLSSLLNPGEVGKVTCNKSISNMVQGKYLYSAQIQRSPGLGKGSWNRQLPPHCPVSASPCLWHQAQGQQAGKHLALPCSIPAQAL